MIRSKKRIVYLNLELMEKICHSLAIAIFNTYEDPIAEFKEHDTGRLDSTLQSLKQTFDGKELYPTLEEKAAVLYYLLNKNHPFKNGNKRIATASLLVFLYLNKKWIKISFNDLLQRTLQIAMSDPKDKSKIFKETVEWIKNNLENS